VVHLAHVSRLSAWASPYLAGYGFPLPFGCQPSLLGPSVPPAVVRRPCGWRTGRAGRPALATRPH